MLISSICLPLMEVFLCRRNPRGTDRAEPDLFFLAVDHDDELFALYQYGAARILALHDAAFNDLLVDDAMIGTGGIVAESVLGHAVSISPDIF